MIRLILSLWILASQVLTGSFLMQKLPAPQIGEVKILTPTLAIYDRFEIRFTVQTGAAYLTLPYDPSPPPGLESGSGISVDAIFTSPSRKTFIQPAFLYQPYQVSVYGDQDHRILTGKPYWLVRFTPQEAGTWKVRLRATDAGGMVTAPAQALSFTVSGQSANSNRQKGFIRVSKTDPRYFEFQNGTPFIGLGFNGGFSNMTAAGQRMQEYEDNGINFLRAWISGSGVNGSQWSPWASFHLPFDGYIPAVSLDSKTTFGGHDLSFRLDQANPCLFQGWQQGPLAVEPNTGYTLTARVKVNNARGTSSQSGFVFKTGGWLDKACAQSGQGKAISQPLSGSSDWVEVRGSLRSGGSPFLDNLYMALQDTSTGEAYVDEVRLFRSDDPNQVNILRQPSANSHLNFDALAAARWDDLLALAETHGIYLKLVVDEKNEWIRNHIDARGNFVSKGDNQNFYGAEGTKVRWLQQAWWRYIIARWGYSTAIHSFEYINEGDPYNGHHYEAADAMARYFDRYDPAQHMVTTSFWHSFPNREFWSNPLYSAVDYADLHAYLTTGWGNQNASFTSLYPVETAPAHRREGHYSIRIDHNTRDRADITPRGLVLREKGEWLVRYWMKASRFTASCPYQTVGGMQRIRWSLDGGTYHGGREGIVPYNQFGQDHFCTSPAGTFDWTLFRSDQDRDGKTIPETYRLFISDNQPHEITLSVENANASGGTAWMSQVELVSPSGKVVPVIGAFDPTRFDSDTAWYNAAYGLLLGGGSPTGAGKPLLRGEAGIDDASSGGWQSDLNKDQQGIWLHNNLWAQLGPGGMTDLMWWAGETIEENQRTGRVPSLYPVFRRYHNFIRDIPINNGEYQDARAQTSDPQIRAWGQRDDQHGSLHLWVQNVNHTWRAVVDRKRVQPIRGSILLPDIPAGTYTITWWDPYADRNEVMKTQTIISQGGMLILDLPAPLATDIAVKIKRQ